MDRFFSNNFQDRNNLCPAKSLYKIHHAWQRLPQKPQMRGGQEMESQKAVTRKCLKRNFLALRLEVNQAHSSHMPGFREQM